MENYPMDTTILYLMLLFLLFALILSIIIIYIRNRHTVAPNEAAIIYGRKSKFINPETSKAELVDSRVVSRGGAFFKVPYIESYIFLNLQGIDIELSVSDIITKNGIRVNVEGVAVVKVANDEYSIRKAGTQFGDTKRNKENIINLKGVLASTLDGHCRSTINKFNADDLYFDREKFSQKLQDAIGSPLSKMGIEVIDFTLKSVNDNQGYFDSLQLGKKAEKEKNSSTYTNAILEKLSKAYRNKDKVP